MASREMFRCGLGIDLGTEDKEFAPTGALGAEYKLNTFIVRRARQTLEDFVAYALTPAYAAFQTPGWNCFATDILNYPESLVLHLADVDKSEDLPDGLFDTLFTIEELNYCLRPLPTLHLLLAVTFEERDETTARRKAWENRLAEAASVEAGEKAQLTRLIDKYGVPQ